MSFPFWLNLTFSFFADSKHTDLPNSCYYTTQVALQSHIEKAIKLVKDEFGIIIEANYLNDGCSSSESLNTAIQRYFFVWLPKFYESINPTTVCGCFFRPCVLYILTSFKSKMLNVVRTSFIRLIPSVLFTVTWQTTMTKNHTVMICKSDSLVIRPLSEQIQFWNLGTRPLLLRMFEIMLTRIALHRMRMAILPVSIVWP